MLLVSPDVTLGGPGSRGMTGMRTVVVPSLPAPGRADYRWSPWLLRGQRAALDLFRPDVVHVTTPDFLGHSAVWWARRRGVCSVCTYHTAFDRYPQYYNAPFARPFLQLLIGSFYNQCDLVAVPSYAAADQLIEAGVLRDKMGFFPRGVNTTLYNPNKRDPLWRRDVFGTESDDEVVILWVARIVREKGIDVFIRAMRGLFGRAAELRGTEGELPPLRLVIAGHGPDLDWLKTALSVRNSAYPLRSGCAE